MNLISANNNPTPVVNLVGFASLPADTFAEGPQAGQNISANGRTGPFPGQPVQGFSGVQFAPKTPPLRAGFNSFWFLSDNGFGSKQNSGDYLLRIYQVRPDFITRAGSGLGGVNIETFVQLRDPNNLIPFAIVNEATATRDLTGSDFDIESFVIDANGDIWVGDEFGPFLLHFAADGILLEAPIATALPLNTLNGQVPLIIGHRGASGSLPEHTLEAYQLAIDRGADFIEPDLVPTKDGVLIARHENALATVQLNPDGSIALDPNNRPTVTSETTNVADLPQFSDRLTVKSIDGELIGGWFSEDFTLAEIKQLRARESIPNVRPANVAFNDLYQIPTFAEVIQLVNNIEATTGQRIGIYPETKHPTFFAKEGNYLDGTLINQNLGLQLVSTLVQEGFTDPSRIFIQSFELANLIELQNQILPSFGNPNLVNIPLVQLFGDTDDAFINDRGGGFSVPYDIVYNYSTLPQTEADNLYGGLTAIVPNFGADITGDGIPDTTYQDLATREVFNYLGQNYAEGLGPWKNSFVLRQPLAVNVDGNGDGIAEISSQLTGEVRPYIDWAHNAGMQVHPYTLRNEERYLTLNVDGTPQTPEQEFLMLIKLGVDGLFTDFPGTGSTIVNRFEEVLSPQNPKVLRGEASANLGSSRGFEGMAFSPDRQTIYPLLEGGVTGDPESALRIYEYNLLTKQYANELAGFYPLEDPSYVIGDFTPINNEEFLVIERDTEQGANAQFKKVFKINLSNKDASGFVAKEEIADLLHINDPNDLNNDGNNNFDFPFVTIEDILVLDDRTILVANDNNYPFSNGRGTDIDNTEIILLELDRSLNLDSRLGNPPSLISNNGAEIFDLITNDPINIEFTVSREAAFNNSLGFYAVENLEGGIRDSFGNLIFPGDPNYTEIAIQSRVSNVELKIENNGMTEIFSSTLTGRYLAPFLVVDGNIQQLLDNNPTNDPTVFFTYSEANSDRFDHFQLAGDRLLTEDLINGGDRDFNDLVITPQFI